MDNIQTVESLKSKIFAALSNRIDRNYWLFDVPHHNNIGDVLIWQGELDFLKSVSHRNKGIYGSDSHKLPCLSNGDLVLFQGGGNFGDLWPRAHDFRKKTMSENPKCRYLIFPQAVWYADNEKLKEDARFFGNFDCLICARDQRSYELLKNNFKNEVILVPDMAFCINMKKWKQSVFEPKHPLLLVRKDREFNPNQEMDSLQENKDIDKDDWAPMSKPEWHEKYRKRFLRNWHHLGFLYDSYMLYIYRPYHIRIGVQQIMSHTDIYTTRLHAGILSILLDKKNIVFFDNSYGKISNFYNTWLKDCESMHNALSIKH